MARGNISIVEGSPSVRRWLTEANTTVPLAGEPVKLKAAGSPYAIICADGDLTIGTDTAFLGICKGDGTQTASADGYVDVYIPTPDLVYESKAKTSTTFDTQSEIDALKGDRVVLDYTSSVWTVDVAATDGANNAFYIVGGDPVRATCQFTCRADATYLSL